MVEQKYKKLINFAKEISKGENIDVVYSNNIHETIIENIRDLSKKTKDRDIQQRLILGADHYQAEFKKNTPKTVYWLDKGALSFYSEDMNHLGIVIDDDYSFLPGASRAIIAHEIYETYWNKTKENDYCREAAKAAGADNFPIITRLGKPLFVIFFTKVLEDTKELIINKKVGRDFPEDYYQLACMKLIENANTMSYHLKNKPIETSDIVYGLSEFFMALEINSETIPIETDERQETEAKNNIHNMKESCLSVFSESQHPVFELSEDVFENIKSIPDKIKLIDMYPIFSNLFDIYDQFDNEVREIELRKTRI